MARTKLVVVLFLATFLPAQNKAAPRVVSVTPANESAEVDPNKTTRIVVKFDRPMSRTGWSFCGGGPKFPKTKAVAWKDAKTIVMDVQLKPDHDYQMSLNCGGGTNFRSKQGVPMVPLPYSFSTLPARLPEPKAQRKQNEAALARVQELLPARYSYYDYHGVDWAKQWKLHRKNILAARTNKGWMVAVAKALRPTNDLHLFLRQGNFVAGAGRRSVDPLYRARGLGRYMGKLNQPVKGVLLGTTKDGFGYLMISAWGKGIDFDQVEELLAQLCKNNKGLILDVRPNAGGNELLARRVAAWFVTGKKVYARNKTRLKKGKDGFSKVFDRVITGNDKKRRYSGKVAVLMSRYCMSSCDAFLLMMKQADRCKLIGQTSYGSSGNPKTHELPNGVRLVMPSWQALLPDGTCFEGKGVAPDISVEPAPAVLDKQDPILERALEYLGK